MMKFLFVLFAGLVFMTLISCFSMVLPSRQIYVSAQVSVPSFDRDEAARTLAGAIRFKTVSSIAGPVNGQTFLDFHDYLKKSFPRVYQNLAVETINGYSLMFTWKGTDAKVLPLLLIAHQDVVPAPDQAEEGWTVPPFAGVIKDGSVWGRGAWDNKGNLLSMLQAIEVLLENGYRPNRTVYLVSGHDEEVDGLSGGRKIAEFLSLRGVHFATAVDEGLLVTHDVVHGVATPVALVGISQKGSLTVKLTAHSWGGHSSQPAHESAVGILSKALIRLEDHPFSPEIPQATRAMLETLAPEMGGLNSVLLSNLGLFGPLVVGQLAENPSSDAMIRTTQAFTVLHAGDRENVIPNHADALVNLRLLAGDTPQATLQRVRETVSDPRVTVEAFGNPRNASKLSSPESDAYRTFALTVREIFPRAIVAPGLMVGGADSRYFDNLADQIFNFSPLVAGPEDLHLFHGVDERMSIENYSQMIRFWMLWIMNN